MLDNFNFRGKFGIFFAGFGILLLAGGMIGYTIAGEVEDVPTPNTPNQAFFSGEPIPSNFLSPLIAADLKITWDRDDVWMGLVDEDEKNRCEDVPSNFFAPDLGCDGSSNNFVAGDSSATASEGFTWEMESGTYYVALGAKDGAIPEGTKVVVSYEVQLGHSLLSILIAVGAMFAGGVMVYYGRE